jgi:hypothetical protein
MEPKGRSLPDSSGMALTPQIEHGIQKNHESLEICQSSLRPVDAPHLLVPEEYRGHSPMHYGDSFKLGGYGIRYT